MGLLSPSVHVEATVLLIQSLGLLLGTEAPVTTPNSADFSFLSTAESSQQVSYTAAQNSASQCKAFSSAQMEHNYMYVIYYELHLYITQYTGRSLLLTEDFKCRCGCMM